MIRKNKDIRDQWHLYNALLTEIKIINDNPILLEDKKNNAYWKIGNSDVIPNTLNRDVKLIVEKSIRDKKYGVKLRCSTLSGEPFFRFDSDGPAHRNNKDGIPLEEQLITTPHFNGFAEDGTSIAYKSDTLKIEERAIEIVNDINFGISLFCMESKCQLNNGNFPNAQEKNSKLFLDDLSVNFDEINFE